MPDTSKPSSDATQCGNESRALLRSLANAAQSPVDVTGPHCWNSGAIAQDDFQKAATPAVILALLDELERARQEISDLKRANPYFRCPHGAPCTEPNCDRGKRCMFGSPVGSVQSLGVRS